MGNTAHHVCPRPLILKELCQMLCLLTRAVPSSPFFLFLLRLQVGRHNFPLPHESLLHMPCLIFQNCPTEVLLPIPLRSHRFPLSEATHSFPTHPYSGAVQERQVIYQFLCFQLLKNTDQDIQDNDRDEEHIGICPDSEQERRDQKVEKIK